MNFFAISDGVAGAQLNVRLASTIQGNFLHLGRNWHSFGTLNLNQPCVWRQSRSKYCSCSSLFSPSLFTMTTRATRTYSKKTPVTYTTTFKPSLPPLPPSSPNNESGGATNNQDIDELNAIMEAAPSYQNQQKPGSSKGVIVHEGKENDIALLNSKNKRTSPLKEGRPQKKTKNENVNVSFIMHLHTIFFFVYIFFEIKEVSKSPAKPSPSSITTTPKKSKSPAKSSPSITSTPTKSPTTKTPKSPKTPKTPTTPRKSPNNTKTYSKSPKNTKNNNRSRSPSVTSPSPIKHSPGRSNSSIMRALKDELEYLIDGIDSKKFDVRRDLYVYFVLII